MIYHEIESYLYAKDKYINTPFRITDGNGYCFVKGEWIPESVFDDHNPKPRYEIAPKANPDGTCVCSGVVPSKSRRSS